MSFRMVQTLLAAAAVISLTGCRASSTAPAGAASSSSSAASASASSDQKEYKVLRVGMECAYAPDNWEESTKTDTNIEEENNPGFYAEGYGVQVAKYISDQVGAEMKVVKLSWDGLIEALNNGQIDMIIAGMADTEERKQSVNFSTTYNVKKTQYQIMLKSDSKYANATQLSDFSGASILGQKDTLLDTAIDQIPGVNHVSPVASVPNMIDRLNAGTVDGIVIDENSAQAYLQTYPDLKVVSFEDGKGFELGFTGACVGLRKSDTDLLDKVNAALASLDTETRQKMMDTATAKMPQ